jgi:hypothetical protein
MATNFLSISQSRKRIIAVEDGSAPFARRFIEVLRVTAAASSLSPQYPSQ